ncbi:structural maintenance of chromosomes protein 4-like [Watersipora subatra]|uniref:structural maintenance of chromosomes protein 4-like n=1 Tax=Watersipora subatra TaxID=2589382 RepID=UPI00355B2F63
MLFVFGFRANKIRSKKLSVLIHNSERHSNITSCTVKVHFQRIIDTGPEDDDYTVVPNTEFTVARTVTKENTSVYQINDKKATAKDVIKLLLSHGIDLDHNRFLILQGEVEMISMMKAKAQTEHEEGMLEYLEDIIGSNRFKEPIELLTKRIDKIHEVRSEKLTRVRVAEKDKNILEGPRNEAIAYLTAENEMTLKKNCLLQAYIYDAESNLTVANEKVSKVKDIADSISSEMASLESVKKEEQKKSKTIVKEFERLKSLCEDGNTQYGELQLKATKAAEDLKHLSNKIKKLEKSLEAEGKKVMELQQAPAKCAEEIQQLEELQEDLLERKAQEEKAVEKVMENIKLETADLQKQKTKLEEKLLSYQEELNGKKSKSDVAKAELDLAKSSYQTEKDTLDRMVSTFSEAGTSIETHSKLMVDLKKRIPDTEKYVQETAEQLEAVIKAEEELHEKLQMLGTKFRECSSQAASRRSQSAQLQGLMEQKRSGSIPGIVGRLGDLGAIDDKYDVAISTACGPLDNIVVDALETGQKCVDYLKKANLGVCTFILLDKMEQWVTKANKPISTPNNAPRLFDLIKYKDARLKGAFYYALRDTLVADDLQQASKIAFGATRYRVVTLAGQLIEISGAMSGGGRPSKGRMGSSVSNADEVSPEKLKEMETKLCKGREKLQSQGTKKADLTRKKEALSDELVKLRASLETSSMELKMYEEQRATLKTEIKRQDQIVKKSQPDPKIVGRLEDNYRKFNDDYEALHSKTSVIEEKSQELHRRIVELSENKVKAAQERLTKVTKELEANKVKVNKLNVAIKSNSRNLKRAEDKEKSLTEELIESRSQEEDISNNQLSRLQKSSEEMLQTYNDNLEKCKEVDEKVKECKTKIDEIEQKQDSLKHSVGESRRELEKHQAAVTGFESTRNRLQRQLDNLSIHKLPGEKETQVLEKLADEERQAINVKTIQYEICILEDKLGKMKFNMTAIAEYRKKEEQYIERVAELDRVTDIRNQQRDLCEEMKRQRLQEFMAGFSLITSKLKEMYQMITLGGDAELELVDTLDPFSEGIVFSVRPPKKSWKNISNLSGGEKTLSSLALVFALHHYRPTPLYVMDEIDAALDFKNVSIVANYIKDRTKNAQFIIISLRDNMFEQGNRLVGIYKTHDATKTVVLAVKDSGFAAIPGKA